MSDQQQTLELNEARTFTLSTVSKSGPRLFTLACRRVTKDDWAAYYAAQVVTARTDGKDQENVNDYETAKRVLAERVLIDATGYNIRGVLQSIDGGSDVTSLPNWQSLIPISHRLKLGAILAFVTAESDDSVIYPTGEAVSLNAVWGVAEDGSGAKLYKGLLHSFGIPTDEQQRRYTRASSRSRVLGGSRSGTTEYFGAQLVLAELYDELILAVEGYTVDGKPLTDKASIAREMDTHHKVIAALQIFAPTPVQVIEDEVAV